jgi:hypothetical protein
VDSDQFVHALLAADFQCQSHLLSSEPRLDAHQCAQPLFTAVCSLFTERRHIRQPTQKQKQQRLLHVEPVFSLIEDD